MSRQIDQVDSVLTADGWRPASRSRAYIRQFCRSRYLRRIHPLTVACWTDYADFASIPEIKVIWREWQQLIASPRASSLRHRGTRVMQIRSGSPATKASRLFVKLPEGRRFYSSRQIILLTPAGLATTSFLILSSSFPPARSASISSNDAPLPATFRLPIRAPA